MQRRSLVFLACLFFIRSYSQDRDETQKNLDSLLASYVRQAEIQPGLNPASAFNALENMKRLAIQVGNDSALSRIYLEKAALSISLGRKDSAILLYGLALDFAKNSGSRRELGNVYLAMANYYQFNGNTFLAAENFLETAKILKETGRLRAVIGLYRNFFIIHTRLQQKNVALLDLLNAVVADKSNEKDLVKLINASSSEEVGFRFPDQSLVKEAGRDAIYVIFGNAKFLIRDFESLGQYGSMRDIQRIPPGSLAFISDFPRDGSVLREMNDGRIYVARSDSLHPLTSFDVLETYGGWDAVYFVPSGSLEKFPRSGTHVTLENRNKIFNFNQEFDLLADSIRLALEKNASLSSELSVALAQRNATLQRKNTLLWTSILGIIALLFIVLLLIRNFKQKQNLNEQLMVSMKYEEETKRKMAIEKERTRIATDMHDDLGAGLSRIRFLSESIVRKKQLESTITEEVSRIREYSYEMIDKMGEIVWALNEKNDSLSDLIGYSRAYAVEYLSQHGIQCKVDADEPDPRVFVGGEIRRNVYLTLKEALHNVVKHSGADLVELRIRTGQVISMMIHDNGKGLDTLNFLPGNGTSNMKKRINEIGGTLKVVSKEGTSVQFSVPINS